MNSQYGRAGDVRLMLIYALNFNQIEFHRAGVSVIKGPSSNIDPKEKTSPVRGSASAAALKWVSK